MQSCGNPDRFETLCLKSFNVAVWIRTLEEPDNVKELLAALLDDLQAIFNIRKDIHRKKRF